MSNDARAYVCVCMCARVYVRVNKKKKVENTTDRNCNGSQQSQG